MDGRLLNGSIFTQPSGDLLVGTLIGLDATRIMAFRLRGERKVRKTRNSMVGLSKEDIKSAIVVGFIGGADGDPVILGKLASTQPDGGQSERTLDLSAERQVTIRCGRASITLTREGKIILRGTYISSRSSGVNRIKGGSVQLN